MTIKNSVHYSLLNSSYNKVGKRTWLKKDFEQSSLESSRNLFTEGSLDLRDPVPKHLEVYALLSGVSFATSFSKELVKIQQQIDEILDGSLRYWVLPANMGIEYCVFKWPDDNWVSEFEDQIYSDLPRLDHPFQFTILGIQINPDGCIVAKGFDEGGVIFKYREKIRKKLPLLPKRQSAWAHVPLGRILEPIGKDKFLKLSNLYKELSDIYIASCEISSAKFIHETQWYMEKKTILREFYFNN